MPNRPFARFAGLNQRSGYLDQGASRGLSPRERSTGQGMCSTAYSVVPRSAQGLDRQVDLALDFTSTSARKSPSKRRSRARRSSSSRRRKRGHTHTCCAAVTAPTRAAAAVAAAPKPPQPLPSRPCQRCRKSLPPALTPPQPVLQRRHRRHAATAVTAPAHIPAAVAARSHAIAAVKPLPPTHAIDAAVPCSERGDGVHLGVGGAGAG
jgi:hypothetical protein